MTIIESIQIALFCFAVVFGVLTVLYLLIKLFSFIIDFIKMPDKKNLFKNKKINKITVENVSKKNTGLVFTTVTDEQGNITTYELNIKTVKDDK